MHLTSSWSYSMALALIQYNPGVVKDSTEYGAGKAGPFWVDSDLVRFVNGYPEKIGGWQKSDIYSLEPDGEPSVNKTAISGICRRMVSWRGIIDGVDRVAVSTSNHLYIIQNDALYDITPLRKTTSNLTNPLTTVNGSATITVTDNSHGVTTGDFVVINSAAATGGIPADTLNRMSGYQVTLVDANTYTIVSPTAASSGATGGGTTIDIKYLIGSAENLGIQSSVPALGWGIGGWGLLGWNEPRTVADSTINLENSSWSLNLWGEDVIATLRNGAIFYWDTSAGVTTRAVLVSSISGSASVPAVNRVTTVSFPDRHFIVAGASIYDPSDGSSGDLDPMLVRWSTQEDFTKFAPTALNTAGDQRLEVGTKIVSIISNREETIISTDEAVYGMTFVGAPFIFSFRLLATGAGSAGINCMISVDGTAYWMANKSFYFYDGVVKEIPCPVKHYVFDRLQSRFIDKTAVGHNVEFNEVYWFYVSNQNTSSDSDNPEPDSYVVYNYAENAWVVGSMDRTVWNDAFGVREKPFAFSSEGFLYNQETGTSDDGSAMNAFIEGSPRELSAEGNNLYMIDRIIPDITMGANSNISVFMNSRKFPNAPETTKGPFNITSSTQKINTRVKGRQISFKFQSTGTQDEWQLGNFRIDTKQAGPR